MSFSSLPAPRHPMGEFFKQTNQRKGLSPLPSLIRERSLYEKQREVPETWVTGSLPGSAHWAHSTVGCGIYLQPLLLEYTALQRGHAALGAAVSALVSLSVGLSLLSEEGPGRFSLLSFPLSQQNKPYKCTSLVLNRPRGAC